MRSREPGPRVQSLRLHGHGLRTRWQLGPTEAEWESLSVRAFSEGTRSMLFAGRAVT